MTEKKETPIVSYKGFDANMQCLGMQYAVGETYTHEGAVKACSSGFHACEYPLDVFNYYPPAGSRFATVEQSGTLSRHDEDSKVASSVLKVSVELRLPGLIEAAIEYTFSRSKPENGATGTRGAASATGDQGAASATGTRGAASATGTRGAASATGYQGAASATGDQGAASATGTRGAASATGYQGAASATGTRGAASATGTRGAASATGTRGAASATGYRGAASATGYQGAASATGDQGAASATGDQGAASATGDQGAASATGYQGRASGKPGNALFLVERDDDYNIMAVWAGIVGRGGVQPDVWYMLKDGKPVEITP